jgi:hypothetical protein
MTVVETLALAMLRRWADEWTPQRRVVDLGFRETFCLSWDLPCYIVQTASLSPQTPAAATATLVHNGKILNLRACHAEDLHQSFN